MTDTPELTVKIPAIHCEAVGIYCGLLGILQLQAAGRSGWCCRHLLDTDEEGDGG